MHAVDDIDAGSRLHKYLELKSFSNGLWSMDCTRIGTNDSVYPQCNNLRNKAINVRYHTEAMHPATTKGRSGDLKGFKAGPLR